jgi:dCTP deaminase
MAILTGPEIRKRVTTSAIKVTPYEKNRVQPNSLDLTLGTGVCVYRDLVYVPRMGKFQGPPLKSLAQSSGMVQMCSEYLDTRKNNPILRFDMDESGWLIKPGILYLMHVVEVLHAPKLVMELDGKSSLARLGITIHFTAGFAETGFHGQYTMEVSGMHEVRVYPGMDFAQVVFHTVEGEIEDYKKRGNYVGDAAMGAQPSRSWKQFTA